MTLLITICTEKVTRDFEFCEHKNASDIFNVVLEEIISEYSYSMTFTLYLIDYMYHQIRVFCFSDLNILTFF